MNAPPGKDIFLGALLMMTKSNNLKTSVSCLHFAKRQAHKMFLTRKSIECAENHNREIKAAFGCVMLFSVAINF